MCLTRKNSRQERKQETAINSSQMKSPFPDLLVWGSKHSTERRQDEPSRPPTAYSLRKTEDGVIPYGPPHTHTHTRARNQQIEELKRLLIGHHGAAGD